MLSAVRSSCYGKWLSRDRTPDRRRHSQTALRCWQELRPATDAGPRCPFKSQQEVGKVPVDVGEAVQLVESGFSSHDSRIGRR